MRVPGTDGRADKRFALLGRYSSEIRTGCANERPSGSVRGAPGNWCPYRDRQLRHTASSRYRRPHPVSCGFGQYLQAPEALPSRQECSERQPADHADISCNTS
jgi:hypothetical protein